jgi:hypothetical protein
MTVVCYYIVWGYTGDRCLSVLLILPSSVIQCISVFAYLSRINKKDYFLINRRCILNRYIHLSYTVSVNTIGTQKHPVPILIVLARKT